MIFVGTRCFLQIERYSICAMAISESTVTSLVSNKHFCKQHSRFRELVSNLVFSYFSTSDMTGDFCGNNNFSQDSETMNLCIIKLSVNINQACIEQVMRNEEDTIPLKAPWSRADVPALSKSRDFEPNITTDAIYGGSKIMCKKRSFQP